jgi:hypothetical protein
VALSEQLRVWDERFRVLTDISQRLGKLEEDVRASRTKKESDIPPTTPIASQESRPTTTNPQPIKLKNAIESALVSDGHRPSVFQFLRACERARSMVAKESRVSVGKPIDEQASRTCISRCRRQ